MSNKHAVKEASASYQSTLRPLGSRELQNFIAGNPLTENLNLWISATKAKSTSGRGSNKKIELVGIKKLRELILELAVRGKLVPQNPEDEPASELLKKIDAEKAKLLAEGKIKKQKKLPEISEDEKPFELPKGWEWARLGTIASYGNPEKAEANKASSKTWILELEDIEKTTSRLIQKIRFNSREFKSTKNVFKAGDVLYGKLRPYLDKVLVADEPGICTTEIIPISCYGGLSPQYLRCYLKSPRFIFYANTSTHGMNLPRLGTDKAITSVVSIPPLEEQHCIVAKVDELMALCDQLEQHSEHQLDAHKQLVETLLATLVESENSDDLATNWQRLAEHFDTLFSGALTSTAGIGNGGGEWAIDRLKDTILQLAVMGKLVPQNPDDEPASELLERIEEEKARLVKEGKIKKPKKLPPVSDEEKPFELPEGWEWGRFASVLSFESELVSPENFQNFDQIGPDSIEKGTGSLLFRRSVKESGIKGPNNRFYKGQLLYSKIRPSLSKAIIAEFDGLCSADMYPLKPHLLSTRFLLQVILSEPFLTQVRKAQYPNTFSI
jgi:type I restriction enzyme S subunit